LNLRRERRSFFDGQNRFNARASNAMRVNAVRCLCMIGRLVACMLVVWRSSVVKFLAICDAIPAQAAVSGVPTARGRTAFQSRLRSPFPHFYTHRRPLPHRLSEIHHHLSAYCRFLSVPTDPGGWLGSRVVSALDSGAEGPGFKSQPRRCRVTVLGKLFTPIAPLFTKQQNRQQPS